MARIIQFPDPGQAEDDGLVAVGGELSSEFILAAYSQGIFPWFKEGEPLLWWSPNPRMVLFPKYFKLSRSLQQTIKSEKYHLKIDENFREVIEACSTIKRKGQSGTWITEDMVTAYTELHHEGFAHCVETYRDDQLIGGLYGLSLGKVFFGESMFHSEKDASKFALYHLNQLMLKWDYHFIDVQQSTPHLRSLGAIDVPRDEFLSMLRGALNFSTKKGNWDSIE